MMYPPTTLKNSPVLVSSQESGGGITPFNLPVGPPTALSGTVPVRASRSRSQAKAKAMKTTATSGLPSSTSSASAALTQYLVSRLKARSATDGSMEYAQTWKEKTTPAGTPRWAHTASGRRTSGSDCIGWPTPAANEFEGGSAEKMWDRREREKAKGRNGNGFGMTIGMLCTGWPTASARDWKDTAGMSTTGVNPDGSERTRLDQLPRVAQLAIGSTPSGFPAGTESTAGFQLNPRFSLWLMGFPTNWHDAGVSALRSSRAPGTP